MHKYPRVNYIGNKEKLANWIIDEMPLKNGMVLDIFSGGCSVSYALKKTGYSVISNDILYANYVLGKAIIENSSNTLSNSIFEEKVDEKRILLIEERLNFLSERLYYPNEIKELARLVAIYETITGDEKYIFLALLRRAMIRKLPYSRMNVPWNQIMLLRDEEYSYKKYKRRRAYHNQTFESHMKENICEYNNAVFKGNECKVYNYDAMKMAELVSPMDIVYIDPPYPSTMNNYDAFYGLFDEMFNEQKAHVDFTQQHLFLENLENLIKTLINKTKYVVLSQNTSVKPEPGEMEKMLSKYGDVSIKEKEHNYQVTGKNNKNSSKELLFILHIQ